MIIVHIRVVVVFWDLLGLVLSIAILAVTLSIALSLLAVQTASHVK